MNRGIARRSVFEDRACVRYFLSGLARVVRRGDLEVQGFVLLTTHYAVARTGSARFDGRVYSEAFGGALAREEVELVEARLAHPAEEADPLDDLVHAAPRRIREWMERTAALADGSSPGLPCASEGTVSAACSRFVATRPGWWIARGGNRVGVHGVLLVALWRDVAGLGWSEIGTRASIGESSAKRRYRIHREWMASRADYRDAVVVAARDCVRTGRRRILS